jgi:hypothetical protein
MSLLLDAGLKPSVYISHCQSVAGESMKLHAEMTLF